jgi:hypothetical protein
MQLPVLQRLPLRTVMMSKGLRERGGGDWAQGTVCWHATRQLQRS